MAPLGLTQTRRTQRQTMRSQPAVRPRARKPRLLNGQPGAKPATEYASRFWGTRSRSFRGPEAADVELKYPPLSITSLPLPRPPSGAGAASPELGEGATQMHPWGGARRLPGRNVAKVSRPSGFSREATSLGLGVAAPDVPKSASSSGSHAPILGQCWAPSPQGHPESACLHLGARSSPELLAVTVIPGSDKSPRKCPWSAQPHPGNTNSHSLPSPSAQWRPPRSFRAPTARTFQSQ